MMGKRKPTGTLFAVGNVFPFRPRPGTFHAQLAEAAPRVFKDESFQDFYGPRRGRYSVPPSELALLLLLQAEAGCADEETLERSACDLRWCAVLDKQAGEPLCAKSTYQVFRTRRAPGATASLGSSAWITHTVTSGGTSRAAASRRRRCSRTSVTRTPRIASRAARGDCPGATGDAPLGRPGPPVVVSRAGAAGVSPDAGTASGSGSSAMVRSWDARTSRWRFAGRGAASRGTWQTAPGRRGIATEEAS